MTLAAVYTYSVYISSSVLDMTIATTQVCPKMITNPPHNTSVTEGEDAAFTCTAEQNGSPVTVGWRFTPRGSSLEVPLLTGTNLTGNGIEMVTVSGSQKVYAHLQWSAEEGGRRDGGVSYGR